MLDPGWLLLAFFFTAATSSPAFRATALCNRLCAALFSALTKAAPRINLCECKRQMKVSLNILEPYISLRQQSFYIKFEDHGTECKWPPACSACRFPLGTSCRPTNLRGPKAKAGRIKRLWFSWSILFPRFRVLIHLKTFIWYLDISKDYSGLVVLLPIRITGNRYLWFLIVHELHCYSKRHNLPWMTKDGDLFRAAWPLVPQCPGRSQQDRGYIPQNPPATKRHGCRCTMHLPCWSDPGILWNCVAPWLPIDSYNLKSSQIWRRPGRSGFSFQMEDQKLLTPQHYGRWMTYRL